MFVNLIYCKYYINFHLTLMTTVNPVFKGNSHNQKNVFSERCPILRNLRWRDTFSRYRDHMSLEDGFYRISINLTPIRKIFMSLCWHADKLIVIKNISFKTRLLGRPQPQMYPPVALNQYYTLVNRTHKHEGGGGGGGFNNQTGPICQT